MNRQNAKNAKKFQLGNQESLKINRWSDYCLPLCNWTRINAEKRGYFHVLSGITASQYIFKSFRVHPPSSASDFLRPSGGQVFPCFPGFLIKNLRAFCTSAVKQENSL